MTRRTKPTLKQRLRAARITHDDIALLGDCSRTYVVHFLAGRRHSPRLKKIAERLLRRAQSPNSLRTTAHVFSGLGYHGHKDRRTRRAVPP